MENHDPKSIDAGTEAASAWRAIESAPLDGRVIHVWADGYEWPETVRWELYDAACAIEAGEPGYWRYAEELLTEVTDSCCPEQWTHWRPIPTPPPVAGQDPSVTVGDGSTPLDPPIRDGEEQS